MNYLKHVYNVRVYVYPYPGAANHADVPEEFEVLPGSLRVENGECVFSVLSPDPYKKIQVEMGFVEATVGHPAPGLSVRGYLGCVQTRGPFSPFVHAFILEGNKS